jgi:5-methylcytosine-specific restriction endonuclease McrA
MANQYTSISAKTLFVKDSSYKNRGRLKARILKDKLLDYVCAFCKNRGDWKEKKLVLVLDHINGVKNDHRLENLRFVCPNCDSQLPTFKSKNIKYQQSRIKDQGD